MFALKSPAYKCPEKNLAFYKKVNEGSLATHILFTVYIPWHHVANDGNLQ